MQSLVEKEQTLLVLQEADSVQQQELCSLHQAIQEAQKGAEGSFLYFQGAWDTQNTNGAGVVLGVNPSV